MSKKIESIIAFSERLRELRKANKMTQEQLAKKLNTTQDTISLWEKAERSPNFTDIQKLIEIFGETDSAYLIGMKE